MRFHSLADWLAWQERLHPRSIDLGLERVREVAGRMGLLEPAPVVITVAGTNGKGSCVAMLEAMLAGAGYRVGAYTSPHLLRYNERVRICGEEAGDAALCESFARIDAARGAISLSYFEFGTLAALDLFARAGLDAMLLEVGLGGRLDAVNILDADVAIVSSVGVDHREWLGQTRESIGREKAGIFRPGRPAVCGDPQPPASIEQEAARLGTPLYRLGREFRAEPADEGWRYRGPGAPEGRVLPDPALPGAAQRRNAACALAALGLLEARLPLPPGAVERGLTGLRLPGRFQRFAGPVETVLDVAHNPDSARTLAELLRAHPVEGRLHAVFALLGDKDLAEVVAPLADAVDDWHVGALSGARARPVRRLAAELRARVPGRPVTAHATVGRAYEAARAAARPGDRVLVFGSFYTVAEVLAMLV